MLDKNIDRRALIKRGWQLSQVGAVSSFLGCKPVLNGFNSARKTLYASCFQFSTRGQKQYFAGAVDEKGHLQSQILLPARGHAICPLISKPEQAIVFARRPGNWAYLVDFYQDKIIHQFKASADHHFYGHGVVTADNQYLITTENQYGAEIQAQAPQGRIVIRSLNTYKMVANYASGGVGPHEIKLLSDGKTLVIANGGIYTHPSQPRAKLNIATMVSNLTYLDVFTGKIIAQCVAPNKYLSLRHLDVSDTDQVVVGAQYQGDKNNTLPLVFSHVLSANQQVLQPFSASDLLWQKMQHYTASVCINNQTVLVSCPRGDLITRWHLDTLTFQQETHFKDGAGIALMDPMGYFLSNGKGQTAKLTSKLVVQQPIANLKWDNHFTVLKGP